MSWTNSSLLRLISRGSFQVSPRMKLMILLTLAGHLNYVYSLNEAQSKIDSIREKRILSIFSVVRFQNNACTSTSTFTKNQVTVSRNGTCYTAAECSSRNGVAAGTCASSFGVCCVLSVEASGTTINQNCTYIRNPGFPKLLTTTTNTQYTVAKCSCDVCYLRLDFECFTTVGTTLSTEANGGQCADTLSITTTTGTAVPTICGQNDGQHIYLDLGAVCSDTATLSFNFDATQVDPKRTYEIKATQVPCGSRNTPPNGCLQYHTGITGRFTTFNFLPTDDNHLRNQRYSTCIRQEEGYCCMQYTPCPGVDSSMSLNTKTQLAMTDNMCIGDYIGIQGSGATCNQNTIVGALRDKYCGLFLSPVDGGVANIPICDCTAPFRVDFVTDGVSDGVNGADNGANMKSRGVCLEYMQIPCA